MDISTGNHILKFWAEWCGPCKSYKPVFDETTANFTKVTVHDVNVDQQGDLASEYGVRGIPTTIFIKDGKVIHNRSGALSKEKLEEMYRDFES